MDIPWTPGEHVSAAATFAMLTVLVKPFQKFRTAKVNGGIQENKE